MHLNQAIQLRNRGLSVFPVSNDTKVPLVKWARLQDELPTYDEVTAWFTPNNRSIGVATGKVSNLFLLDFDFAKHPESKVFYDSIKGSLPRTWIETTKSGGLHYYFRWTPTLETKQTNTTSVISKGVDTKGQGGYAKITPSDGYSWINPPHLTPLAVPPEWLIDLLPAKGNLEKIAPVGPQNPGSTSWLSQALSEIKEGNRDNGFTKVAGSLISRGYTTEDIFNLLRGKAAEVLFSEADLKKVCESVGRYSPAGLVGTTASSVENFLADIETVEWICEPIIARKTLGFVAGLPETLKTWILIDLAVECAKEKGGIWLGRFPVNKGRVLFIDQERFKGETQRRFRAVIAAKNLNIKDLGGSLFIRCGTSTRINLEHSYQAFRKELADLRPDLVLIDSFATFHTTEENNRGDIQAVLERIKQLRNEFGCTFIFIDHENKGVFQDADKDEQPSAFRMVGSIAKPAAAELVLTVRRHPSEGSWVYHTKSTLASTLPTFLVKVTDMNEEKTQIKVEAF